MSTSVTQIRSLDEKDLPEMFRAFKSAFSDYSVPFDLSEEQFLRKFVDKLNINFMLSAGAYSDDRMAGFIFSSINKYEGLFTAYNGGTGVLPEYRGKGITYRMYDYLLPLFHKEAVAQCILEVLTSNQKAINVYKNIGFQITRNFKCYKFNPASPVSDKENILVQVRRVESPDWKTYTKFFDYIPSYLDSRAIIQNNISNEVIIEAELDEKTVGYAIFQPIAGRISHLAVDTEHRGNGIGSMLLRRIYTDSLNKSLTMLNVLEEASNVHGFLIKSGFENDIDQYEMRMRI